MCGKCLSVLAFAEKTDKTNDILSGTVICIMLAGETGPSVEKEMQLLIGWPDGEGVLMYIHSIEIKKLKFVSITVILTDI